MDRKNRISELRQFLKDYGYNENNFDKILERLKSEIQIEEAYDDNYQTNKFLNQLRQTLEKQAEEYIYTKKNRPKSSCYSEFVNFVNAFEADLSFGRI